jgi:hypothetical protein
MKFLSQRVHGFLDYAAVAAFLAAPATLHLSGFPAFLSYALGGVHGLITFHTNFPLGVVKRMPFRLHATIELLVGVLLLLLPQLSPAFDGTARPFFTVMGGVIFVAWLFSNMES